MKIFGRDFVKILVDHAAIALIVNSTVLILLGIYEVIAARHISNYEYQGFVVGAVKTLMSGLCCLAGGLLLLIGIIKVQKVLILIYFIFSTSGLCVATGFSIYFLVSIYPNVITSLFFTVMLIFMFILKFAWVTQYCVFMYYKQIAVEELNVQGRYSENQHPEPARPLYYRK